MTDNLTEADRRLCEALDDSAPSSPWHPEMLLAARRIRELSRQLAAAEADAARLAEALGECADDIEAEVEARRGAVLERTTRRDLMPVVAAREALAAHTARLIDG